MPRHGTQDRIVRSAGKSDAELLAAQAHSCLPLDEEPVDLGGITVFKAPQLSGQQAIEGVGDHGHDHIKVHLHQNGGRKRVQVEELDGL